ncbi:MAG: hypothetical protein JF609_10395, partial [Verrucomicrobia bacterium]|nr:hypothetical protein [Verrucomicrobiota bacterium]
MIIIAVLALLFLMLDFPAPTNAKRRAQQVSCANNLKQIMLSEAAWPGDHHNINPMQTSVTNGGAMELMNSSEPWRVFQVISNELSVPKILFCPADKTRTSATNFDDSLRQH